MGGEEIADSRYIGGDAGYRRRLATSEEIRPNRSNSFPAAISI
jgi:hypothetical protein